MHNELRFDTCPQRRRPSIKALTWNYNQWRLMKVTDMKRGSFARECQVSAYILQLYFGVNNVLFDQQWHLETRKVISRMFMCTSIDINEMGHWLICHPISNVSQNIIVNINTSADGRQWTRLKASLYCHSNLKTCLS